MTPTFVAIDTPLDRGTTLIEASAGTGKTYTITALFLRLLLEEDLQVSEILVTTYTEAATAELRDRIRSRLSGALVALQAGASEDPFLQALLDRHSAPEACEKLERALREFDQAAIHTIHGFCQRMLRDRALESGMLFDTELVTDQKPILQELVDDFWRTHFATAAPIFGALAGQSGVNRDRMLKLLNGVTPRPLLHIIPALPVGDFEQLKGEVASLHQRLCESWGRDGLKARASLLGPPKWTRANGKLGSEQALASLFTALDDCLGSEPASLTGFELLERLCQSAIDKACLKNAVPPQSPFFTLCDEYRALRDSFQLRTEAYFLDWARVELRRRKALRNILCFDDLLTRLHGALHGERGDALATALRARFKAALIDEFQDTDGVQEAIFHRVFGTATGWLYLIGDPKQAIYGFRGADIFSYLAASRAAAHKYTLGTNRRSASRLVSAVNHLFGRQSGAFVVDGIVFDPVQSAGDRDKTPLLRNDVSEPPFKIWTFNEPEPVRMGQANRQLPAATAAAIAELLASGATIGSKPVHPSQIAVLVAQHRQARAVQEALQSFNVPSVLLSDESVWKTEDAGELHTIMAAVAHPASEPLVRAALATEILGSTVSGLQALRQSETEWENVLLRFTAYGHRWHDGGFIQMFRSLVLGERVRPRLLSLPDGDRRLTNLMHLAELLHRAAIEQHLTPAALLRWFEAQLGSAAPPRDDESVLRLERDDDAVNIITMHRSKGLEFEIVFCPYAWGRSARGKRDELLVFHDTSAGERLTLDLGSAEADKHRALQACEQLAEEARILYVALTRAMYECHFVWGRFYQCEVSSAAWLLHRPPQTALDCVMALREHMGELTAERFESDLEQLRQAAPESIEVRPLSVETPPQYSSESSSAHAKPAPREFHGSIDREWSLASFTSLIANRRSERRGFDEVTAGDAIPSGETDPYGIHALPGGMRTGVCLHRILEKLDFADENAIEPLVRRQLTAFSFDALSWTSAVSACLRKTVSAETGYGFALKDTAPRQRLTELEFHLPAERIGSATLMKLLHDQVEPFTFDSVRGWLKGFIDVICEHEGRYYIVDWKSDRLGAASSAYTSAAMRDAMVRNRYTLQLHLYTLALHRYLRVRLPGYDYEKHFGGVLYYFLRGIDPAAPDLGIYRYRPALETINGLEQWLNGEK